MNSLKSESPAELRGFIMSTKDICILLQKSDAEFKGEYAFTDSIYTFKAEPFDLNNEFVRLREYKKTAWDQKNIVLVHKKIETRGQVGSNVVFKKEFDSLIQAESELYSYQFLFSFSRTGTEYFFNDMRIFVEDIQGLSPSIEVIAPSSAQIYSFFTMINAKIVAESVPALISKNK